MSDAIASLRDRRHPVRRPWGSLQVAGDRGAPPIALGGGTGDAVGNANALASRWAEAQQGPRTARSPTAPRTSRRSRSSPAGRVDARTILTYGQSEDPTLALVRATRPGCSPRGRWVHFPWTRPEVRRHAVSTYVVVALRLARLPSRNPVLGQAGEVGEMIAPMRRARDPAPRGLPGRRGRGRASTGGSCPGESVTTSPLLGLALELRLEVPDSAAAAHGHPARRAGSRPPHPSPRATRRCWSTSRRVSWRCSQGTGREGLL